jgi:hypothetical protein
MSDWPTKNGWPTKDNIQKYFLYGGAILPVNLKLLKAGGHS